ncbi:MAG TPA: SDR family NAD(P)-dependent oxidoreductase [Alphaproteobacteria bacterium]|nr:SDR family NAD(P)-dependent oxidoreductase [Alphaproteobacteria bacterium]
MVPRPSGPPRSVLISGASSGIGAALAQRYAAPDTHLFLCGRDADRLGAVAAACRAAGARVEATVLDVAVRPETERWVRDAEAAAPLDLVIANAGVSAGTSGAPGTRGFYGESTEQTRRILAVNVEGVLNTVAPALPAMQARARGHIALMSSLAAFRGLPGAAAYSASKAAVKTYGEALRLTLAPSGIAVTVICPGFVDSRITERNRFPMPLKMSAERAADLIARRLERAPARIAFPLPLYAAVWLLGALPPAVGDRLLKHSKHTTYGD